MDRLGLFGILLAIAAIVGGNALEGGSFQQLVNFPAALIVLGGTFAAAAIQTPARDFMHALWWMRNLFRYQHPSMAHGLAQVCQWSVKARKNGPLALEAEIDGLSDRFSRRALQLLVDSSSQDDMRATLEAEMVLIEQKDLQAARVLESMGGYAPTLGILGAVIGLIQVLGNMSDPDQLGAGIATAFVATVYGVGIANLLFIPLANRIRALVSSRYQYHEMLAEGAVLIAAGKAEASVRQRLLGYLG